VNSFALNNQSIMTPEQIAVCRELIKKLEQSNSRLIEMIEELEAICQNLPENNFQTNKKTFK
jgi:hypothetical protein